MKNDAQKIRNAVEQYFNGVFHGDPALLRDAFHSQAVVYDNAKDGFRRRAIADYIDAVMSRQSPESQGEVQQMEILHMDVLADQAMVTASVNFTGNRYYNALTLLRLDGRWWIVSKTFVNATAA
jgi:hypothetical protein